MQQAQTTRQTLFFPGSFSSGILQIFLLTYFLQNKFQPIGQTCVFKGSFDVNLVDLLGNVQGSSQSLQSAAAQLKNKIHLCCEIFLVSSSNFSLSESIGQWNGYTLMDQGSAQICMYFDSYNCCCLNTEFSFYWTGIQIKDEKLLEKELENKNKKHGRVYEQSQLDHLLRQQIVKLTKQYNNKAKQLDLNEKAKSFPPFTPNGEPLKMKNFRKLIRNYNQTIYQIWKSYQQFFISEQNKYRNKLLIEQYIVQGTHKNTKQERSYLKKLNNYHLKHNIILTDLLQPEKHRQENLQTVCLKDSKKMQNSPSKSQSPKFRNIQSMTQISQLQVPFRASHQLPIYPFKEHQIQIKLTHQDFNRLNKPQKMKKAHLIVFVHGYQASNFDMQSIATYFKYRYPDTVQVLISSSNEGRTQQKIQQSGHRLAIQIKNFINNRYQNKNFQLSFVCHSMGGIIVRASLKYLQLYKNKMRMFLSLCSPHLGYLCHSSTLINTSLWVLNQIKKQPSMLELTMQDNIDIEKTYLYELSKRTQLEWFQFPIFVGSRQDEYVPFWSALARDKDFFFDTKNSKVYKTLYNNFTKKLQPKIIRLEAIYKDKITDLSSFVGRTAHIKILSSLETIQLLSLLNKNIL